MCAYLKEQGVLVYLLQYVHLIDCVGMVVAVLRVDGKLSSLNSETHS